MNPRAPGRSQQAHPPLCYRLGPRVPEPHCGADREGPAAVCEVGGRLQPLLGRYAPEVADSLADSLAAGAARRDAVTALDPLVIGEPEIAHFGDPERIVFNVNSPEDLVAAERLLGRTGRFTRLRAGLGRGDSPTPV